MGFKADDVVLPLDFDFRPHVDCSGTIMEPTDAQLRKFMTGVSNMIKALTPTDLKATVDADTLLEVMAKMLDGAEGSVKAQALNEEVHTLCVEVCGGFPSAQQIKELPPRIRTHFYGWLTGQLISPETSAAVTNPSLALVTGG